MWTPLIATSGRPMKTEFDPLFSDRQLFSLAGLEGSPISAVAPSPFSMPIVSNADDITTTRRMIRRSLDDESDFVVRDSEVTFRQTFETVEFAETFSRAPPKSLKRRERS